MPTVIGMRRRSKSLTDDCPSLVESIGIDPGPLRTSSPSVISASDVSSLESDDEPAKNGGQSSPPSSGPRTRHKAVPPTPTRPSSWADIDPSVLLALAAPIGSWLTGGDHVKNLFLVLLLVIYLHQLITVPWELYLKARSRRPHTLYPPSAKNGDPEVSRLQMLAKNELYQLEIIYLLLTVVAPFLGATMLRYVLRSLSGVDNLSWFSTTLFVLATGIRPWSHLLHRLRSHTEELHSVIHYPTPEVQLIADARVQALLDRVQALESELAEMRLHMTTESRLQEAYDDLGESIDRIERARKKNERKTEAARLAQESRISVLEKASMRAFDKRRMHFAGSLPPYAVAQGYSHPHTARVFSAFVRILYYFWYLITLSFLAKTATPPQSPSQHTHHNGRLPPRRMKSPPGQLETIQEDSHEAPGAPDSESDSDFADTEAPRVAHSRTALVDSASAADVAANVVTIPYRLSLRLLKTFAPPVGRLWV
ncbi:hypothetical protein K488DRAFT_74030 [Vararia minispora EC-137]|uniref:Uncharacterized protein n=1 Tax=Vararia minispora EC-137 TaxID=1314806 RepID=A0ACB8Q8Q7_9AGAM|nr:hypothetical protein K488DRAFT_74030 [Vararia minispora EC-137]